LSCPGITSVGAWYMSIDHTNPTYTESFCGIGGFQLPIVCSRIDDNEFQPEEWVHYTGGCVDVGTATWLAANPVQIPIWMLMGGNLGTPASGDLILEYIPTHLVRYPAMEGKQTIPGTPL